VPSDSGQIIFQLPVNAVTSEVLPFQPHLTVGASPAWLAPLVISDEQFMAADASGNVYVVGINPTPVPHLAAAAQVELDLHLAAGPVIVGQQAFVAGRSGAGDSLTALTLPDLPAVDRDSVADGRERSRGLQTVKSLDLTGRLRWGPFAVGDSLVVATQPGSIRALDSTLQELWTLDCGNEQPIGPPAVMGNDMLIASTSGSIWRIKKSSGEIIKKYELHQPLGAGPELAGGRLAIRAADGAVLFLKLE
jgi:outer membrane protein assembly factor BamB